MKAKKGAPGDQPRQGLKYFEMWSHYDFLLKNATEYDMIQINTKIINVIQEYFDAKKN